MDTNIDNLKRLIDQIKSIGFWQRLFGWRKIKSLLIDAATDLQKLISSSEVLKEQNNKLENLNSGSNSKLESLSEKVNQLEGSNILLIQKNEQLTQANKILIEDAATAAETIRNLSERKTELDLDNLNLKRDLEFTKEQLEESKNMNAQFVANEESKNLEHTKAVATLANIQKEIQETRNREVEDRHQSEIQRLEKLKLTWTNHEELVKQTIKSICSRHIIEYVDKVPFKGDPDNTLKISDEFIVFDAKSPRGEDLNNFPKYLKEQVENVKKYAKQDNVKKWIFLVVPTNTLECIDTYIHHLADYDAFIISVDALEPIILSLKKVEDYEFAEQLSPEDRENICRVLGKFAHLTKRRIQIDSFFIKQFMELAYKAESDLPKDFLDKVIEFEKAEKLNPPTERRTKQISLKELEKETDKLRNETTTKGIAIVEDAISNALNESPLYSE